MKTFNYINTLSLVLLSTSCSLAQTNVEEKIAKELHFADASGATTLIIANINGSIHVTGSESDHIQLEAVKKISANTSPLAEKGKKEITVGTIDHGDTLIVYIEGVCQQFGKKNHKANGWDYDWNYCNCNNAWNKEREEEYKFHVDFTLQVSSKTNVIVSTINEGDIHAENLNGAVYANNINGNIALKNIAGETKVHAINGNVDIDYAKNPVRDCQYYSLNGDIKANFNKGLAANMHFKSFQGDFYTNVPALEATQSDINKKQTEKGFKFDVKGNNYRIGKGGVHLDFETFNGNLYLKEK